MLLFHKRAKGIIAFNMKIGLIKGGYFSPSTLIEIVAAIIQREDKTIRFRRSEFCKNEVKKSFFFFVKSRLGHQLFVFSAFHRV